MKYYSPDEAAELLRVQPKTVYKYIGENKLFATRLGSNYRISKKQLDNFKKYNWNYKLA